MLQFHDFQTEHLIRSIRLVLTLSTLCSLGCGGGEEGPPMYQVSGTINFEGQPVETGRILFRSEGAGKAFSSEIENGEYQLKTEAGKMTVEIRASRIIPGKFDTSNPDDDPQPVGEMYIPQKYNTQTELEATVKPEGKNHIPFDLTA